MQKLTTNVIFNTGRFKEPQVKVSSLYVGQMRGAVSAACVTPLLRNYRLVVRLKKRKWGWGRIAGGGGHQSYLDWHVNPPCDTLPTALVGEVGRKGQGNGNNVMDE